MSKSEIIKKTTGAVVSAEPKGHLDGLKLSFTTVSTVTVASGEGRDSTNTDTITLAGSKVADITLSGAGGLDTGAEAADTLYAVHVIGDSNGVNASDVLLSLSPTAPTLPGTHDIFRRIGWVKNNSTSNLISFDQMGSGRDRHIFYDDTIANLAVLTSGTATVFTAVDLSTFVPSTSQHVILLAQFETSGAGSNTDDLRLRPTGSTVSTPLHQVTIGVVSTKPLKDQIQMPTDSSQSIDYKVDSANNQADLGVSGYIDEL